MATRTIAITGVDVEEHTALKRVPETLERSMSNVARRAIRFYVAHIDEAEAELRKLRAGDPCR